MSLAARHFEAISQMYATDIYAIVD